MRLSLREHSFSGLSFEQLKHVFLTNSVNKISTHNFQKSGFRLLHNVDYDTFTTVEGRRPWKGISKVYPEEKFGIMDKQYVN